MSQDRYLPPQQRNWYNGVGGKVSDKTNIELVGPPLLKNYPGNLDDIEWDIISKEDYIEMEDILTNGVKFFDPILVENFYPQEMFNELVEILTSEPLHKVDYSNQMNKWEQGFQIPQKIIDYALEKTRSILGTDDIELAYNMYAHHQITTEGRVPRLPLHIDYAPGSYMIDLHIGGNRDWPFVARYDNFITKPNDAIICQPQFDFHYRPSWNSNNEEEYYQAFFLHLTNKDHWYKKFGIEFRDSEKFCSFQEKRKTLFDQFYLKAVKSLGLPDVPWREVPTAEDTHIHTRTNILPAKEMEKK